jgi:hypothetical protein
MDTATYQDVLFKTMAQNTHTYSFKGKAQKTQLLTADHLAFLGVDGKL